MNASFELGLQPFGKAFNELLAEVGSVPRPTFLKRVVQVSFRNVGDVNGIAAKVIIVMGDQGKTVLPVVNRFGVDSVVLVRLAILVEADDLIDPHGIDQLAMPSTLVENSPARSSNPVSDFR